MHSSYCKKVRGAPLFTLSLGSNKGREQLPMGWRVCGMYSSYFINFDCYIILILGYLERTNSQWRPCMSQGPSCFYHRRYKETVIQGIVCLLCICNKIRTHYNLGVFRRGIGLEPTRPSKCPPIPGNKRRPFPRKLLLGFSLVQQWKCDDLSQYSS